MLGSGVVSWLVLGDIKRELSPMEDRGVVLAQVNAPDGSTLDFTNHMHSFEKVGKATPEPSHHSRQLATPRSRKAIYFSVPCLGKA